MEREEPGRASGATREGPREVTAAEGFYLRKQKQANTPLLVELLDGEKLEGRIEWSDRDCIKIRLETGRRILVMKRQIRYMRKAH